MNKFKLYRQAKSEYAYSLYKKNQSFEKVRALIIKDNKILLVHKIKSDKYTLPGGGVENGENYIVAVEREACEETKAKVKFKSVEGILNYNVNMMFNKEKFISSRIEYYCLCDFVSFIKKRKFFGLNGEFFERVEVVWYKIEDIEKSGLSDYAIEKIKAVANKIAQTEQNQPTSIEQTNQQPTPTTEKPKKTKWYKQKYFFKQKNKNKKRD